MSGNGAGGWFGNDVRALSDEQKDEILLRLRLVWQAYPSLRLGQLLGNAYHSTDSGGVRLYYTEDFDLIEGIENFYAVPRIADDEAAALDDDLD